MDFLAFPPEVTAALIHSGPGAGSLIEASDAWQRLGANLEESAGIFVSALSPLVTDWQGPSSQAMVEAVQPYLRWVRNTAQQAQQVAAAAQAAVAAFTAASAAMVPVAQVTANRTRLMRLLATNGFGMNLPAIAATEDEYQSMWANNSAVMNRYQAASAQATTLPLFTSPPQIANPTAAAAQASAVSSAATTAATAATPAAVTPQSILTAIENFNPKAGWFGLANTYANQFISSGFPINMLSYLAQSSAARSLQAVGGDIGTGLEEGMQAVGGAPGTLGGLGAAGLSAEPTAALNVGVSLGKLTAPPAVVGLLHAPQIQLASAATPLTAADPDFPLPPLMPPPIPAGSGWRKRNQQKYEEDDDAEDEEYEAPARGVEVKPPETAGSGWRKRANYDDIEFGAELPGKVMKTPPSAG